MKALTFAARSLARQPGRAVLGVLGIAAVGALLFDMVLLSSGLVVSFRDLLDGVGFDVRVMASDAMPLAGPRITNAMSTTAGLASLPEIAEVVPFRIAEAQASGREGRSVALTLIGANVTARRPWVVVEGRDLASARREAVETSTSGARDDNRPGALLVNRHLAGGLKVSPGGQLMLRASCAQDSVLPAMVFQVVGVADFPFDDESQMTAASSFADFSRACGREGHDEADLLLIAAREGHGPEGAVQAIGRVRPDLHAFTNEQIVARMQRTGFSYFRQISAVLSSITLFFGFLLITVLLTVSVNQRVAEIAALRALGFSRRRIVLDVLCQSSLLVGTGGVVAVPLGFALTVWLDRILKAMPGIPATMHFFVFESRALVLHLILTIVTALLAAVYPMRLVARLPIAATLRNEVVS